jgi:peptidoglycan/xylan/chitin deacetylase (PgdA/CDA1 family)
LDPVRAALDAAPQPIGFFFRDDDAGWDDGALWRLLDRSDAHGVHIDVAVIPAELDAQLGSALRHRAANGLAHLHQHGYAHVNHETAERKCEFGDARSAEEQRDDIARGRALLAEHLESFVEPVFTPPWNRCTRATADALVDLGFDVLSRDSTSPRFGRDDLAEVPVSVDWFAKQRSQPLTRSQVGERIAAAVAERIAACQIRDSAPVGVMLHHAATTAGDLELIDELFALVARHHSATSTSILCSSS